MPILSLYLSAAMYDAVKQHATIQSKRLGKRIRLSDIVVASLRLSGFEREDVLEKLSNGEHVDIDVRRRSPNSERPTSERIREYLELKGCVPLTTMTRNLHIPTEEARRGVGIIMEETPDAIQFKAFDRPTILHWAEACRCTTALCVTLPHKGRT